MNDAISLEVPLLGPPGYDPFWDDMESPIRYYDRRGNQLTFREYGSLRQLGKKYVVLRQEDVGPYWVSTVWLGLDHSFSGEMPQIFETMVFNNETDKSDLACERYATEEQALAGHKRIVAEVRLIVAASEP